MVKKRKTNQIDTAKLERELLQLEDGITRIREALVGHEVISTRTFNRLFKLVLIKEIDKYSNIWFLFNTVGEYIGEIDKDTGDVWLSTQNIWDIIRAETGYTYTQAKNSLTKLIEQHFGLTNVTLKKSTVRKNINDYK